MMFGYHAARRAYAAFSGLVFEKPSLITASALATLEEGQVVNMMSVDCLTIAQVTTFLQFVNFGMFTIMLASTGILLELGVVGLPAIVLLILAAFANKKMGDHVQKIVLRKNNASDQRNVKLNEALQGMRAIKLYAWEDIVKKRIEPIRREEEKALMS